MGDSDDDVDYKRRDKFRTERRGYDGPGDRGSSPGGRGRDSSSRLGGGTGGMASWDRNNRDRGRSYNDGYRRYSPVRGRHEMSPPHSKRMRNDWDDRGYYDSHSYDREDAHYNRGPASRGYVGGGRTSLNHQSHDNDVVQPPMMTFKSFLATQDDSISDDEAIKKYAEYKLEFRRQQLNEFFVNHKDEEWFKLKYHPEDSVKRKEEQKNNLVKRIAVFEKLYEENKFAGKSLDGDQCEQLVRLLDSVVILLEGGTDRDLLVLDKTEEELNGEKKLEEENKADEKSAEEITKNEVETKEEVENGNETKNIEEQDEVTAQEATQKKESDEALTPTATEEEGKESASKKEEKEEVGDAENNAEDADASKKSRKRKRTKEFDESSGSSSSSSSSSSNEDNDEEEGSNKKSLKDESKDEEKMEEETVPSNNTKDDEEGEKKLDEDEPRALHKTASIFLRNLAPTITKQEVEAMCKRYPGFLRAAIADPQPDRRWFRRGWVTFERGVKIKEICFNLNNIRLRDCELGPIVNRDLSRRIRTVNGITVDKKIVRNDIKMAAKVITNLDKKWGLWATSTISDVASSNGDAQQSEIDSKPSSASKDDLGLGSNNPILKNITDYLIEEASAEEEELLGKNNDLEDGEEGEEGNSIVRDEELIQVLDRLLFYLRIVHSVDFYNHSEYPNEDEMPNRCGIMHARGIPPTSNVTQAEIDDYCSTFEKKMGSFLVPKMELETSEAVKLGMKSEDDEVEKFVQANTQELGKDKWLCPLSGKKFKGPDFVRKHIFNKHSEKIEEVKKEVKYYNNYLKDPKRPMLPEHPHNKPGVRGNRDMSGGGSQNNRGIGNPDPYHYTGQPREATSYPVYDDRRDSGYGRDRYGGSDRGYRGGGGGPRPRQDYGRGRVRDRMSAQTGGGARYDNYGPPSGRPIITYRDLDAPREDDYF